MTRRWGQNPENLTDSRSTWDLEPDYLSFAIVNLIFAYSPKCIILGGAAINPGLFATIRLKVK